MDAQWVSLGISAAVAVIVLVGLTAVGAWALPKLKQEKQGYPLEVEIEAALAPYAFRAICGAFKMSEEAVKTLGSWMSGADKKALADMAYKLLPDMVGTIPIGMVKTIVPLERWEAMVQDLYDGFMAFYDKNQTAYCKEFEDWKAAYEASMGTQADPEAMAGKA